MDDKQLILLLKKNDKKAFKCLFLKYYSVLCEYASQYITDSDSEELVQELMLYIWEHRSLISINSSVRSYLFTSVRNRCFNAIRDKRYKEQVHSHIFEKLKTEFEDPELYQIKELEERINKAVKQLPPKYRDTFILSRVNKYTNKEVAAELGISIKTVEYRISQAIKILRLKLKDYLTIVFIF